MDEPETPTHRRRSSSATQAMGSQKAHGRQSSLAIDGLAEKIPEESDAGPSSSDVETDDLNDLEDDEETGLTHTQRKKRRRRKRKNRQLDERIAGEESIEKAEARLVQASMLRHTLGNGFLIALWYTFSISISVYNKWMFSKENLDFHFPLFTTSIHMLVQFALASAVLYFIPRFRPKRSTEAEYTALDGTANTNRPRPANRPLMTKWFYLSRISPCGTATALDIGLGNFSLRFISLTFFTMCKSSVLAFVLLFAFIFRLEKPTWKLCGIIIVMTAGVIMMVAGETAFNALGFILVMTASFCSGFRWSLTQILLLRNPATSNPFSSIFFLTPVMFVALFVLAMPIEGPAQVITGMQALGAAKGWLLGTCIILFPGFLAFLMVAAEFALLKRTSVVTLSVCGIFKEVLTISAAGAVFGDELSPINISGLAVTIASIAAYNYLKYTKMAQEARKEAHEIIDEDLGESVPMRNYSEQHKGGLADPDDFDLVDERRSTSALMKDDLSLPTDTDVHAGKPVENGSVSGSPLKRPENLE